VITEGGTVLLSQRIRKSSWLFNNAVSIENILLYECQIMTSSESENKERDYIQVFRMYNNQYIRDNDEYSALIFKNQCFILNKLLTLQMLT
jgi:hypothetical protein